MQSKLEIIDDVIQNGYRKVKYINKKTGKGTMMLLDGSSAKAMRLVHDALKPENKEKFLSLSWPAMANIAWKHVSF